MHTAFLRRTLWVLPAASLSCPAIAQGDGASPTRYHVNSRTATYEVLESPSEGGGKCLYRDQTQLLCPGTAFIAFEKHYRTKDYDLILISMGETGSGTRWWDWKVIVDDGKQATVKPFADECLECDIQVENLDFRSNKAVFTYRQKKQEVIVSFHAGKLTERKKSLNSREPLDQETCNGLFGNYEECTATRQNAANCTMARANAGHFFLMRTEDRYAGISYKGLQLLCKNACSTGKAMKRETFLKKVCRR
ncbi:hypothetical protein JQ631_23990 [Bradyrhizobium manausense]|uniref:hypothetical protein n=1 Tax=Bradyrhizobium manausense TaxID=989370 RepID=UPI001BADF689|nr:hypothetical protein [Bradyrhizobium manausense]MBR0792157.1 hypothetical protein [Bradyrhizobium manausense]